MRVQKGNISDRISELVVHYANGNNSLFATIIGTSEANVRNYRNGVQPKFEILASIAQKFEISCEWLLTGSGDMLLADSHESSPCKEESGVALAETQKELIVLLKEKISTLESEVSSLKKELKTKNINRALPADLEYGRKYK